MGWGDPPWARPEGRGSGGRKLLAYRLGEERALSMTSGGADLLTPLRGFPERGSVWLLRNTMAKFVIGMQHGAG